MEHERVFEEGVVFHIFYVFALSDVLYNEAGKINR